MVEYTKPFGEQDIGAVMSALSAETKEVWAGDLRRAEAMLFGQAHALQAIFMNLARRARAQEYMKNMDTYMRMALKAQNQCRMTLESLAAIKNPPVVFARQANIAHGPQQVNNGVPSDASRAAERSTLQTELLEVSDGQWLDTRTAGAASGADPHLEAVAPVHRAAKR